jgi:serine/threonine protein phosphatase PrpC
MQETIQLPNVRVGSEIRERIARTGIKGLRCTDDAGLGLDFDEESGTLSGTPRQAGEFVLKFRGVLDGRPLEISARLAVIPDPRSLWTSEPSDRNAPFYKPDEDKAVVRGDLFCVAASKRGRSHARTGACRDDDFAMAFDAAGGWHVAVVADGAGSADWSRRGSELASRTVRDILPGLLATHLDPVIGEVVRHCREGDADAAKGLENWFYRTLVTASFEAARAIESEARAHGTSRNRFLTTLITTVARRVGGDWLFAGFSIGDGGAAVFDLEQSIVRPLTAADSGEFAGQTRFLLTSEFEGGWDSLRNRAFLTVLPSFTALVLMTDGITDPKFPTDVVFQDPKAWADFWRDDLTPAVDLSPDNAEAARQLLDWMDFWSAGNHDDRTMAILVP